MSWDPRLLRGRLAEPLARSQFLRDRAGERRDELQQLLDEAASVLGLGATRLRQAWEADRAARQATELQPWSEQVFTIGQRLRLRLPADDPIVIAFDAVRQRLVTAGELASQQDAETYEVALAEFEAARASFLATSQAALDAPIKVEKGRRS